MISFQWMEGTKNLCGASRIIIHGNYFCSKHGSRKKVDWEEFCELDLDNFCTLLAFLDTLSKTFARNSNFSKNKTLNLN
jgi:hypothetical protein